VAKKAKTPPPPRRVQAPKSRTGGDDGRRARLLLYGAAAAGALALAVVLVVVLSGRGSGGGSNVARLMADAGCTFRTVDASVPKGKPTHVNSLTAKLAWNTFPPSNGQHYPAWAVWGFYTEPVNPRQVVHNEEHGGVILGDRREAERALQRGRGRDVRDADPGSRQQDRDHRLDGRSDEVRP
jgi:hypothetical protein